MSATFPRRQARTRGFTLGMPRAITIAPHGGHLLFLRTRAGDDPVTVLWCLERPGSSTDAAPPTDERVLVDPRDFSLQEDELPAEERARRERAREVAGGVTSYATDDAVSIAAFTLGGTLYTVEVASGIVVAHPSSGPAFDPRLSPDGRRVSYHADDGVHLLDLVGGPTTAGVTRPVVFEDGVSWGRAEFVAAEEMGRTRGTWWSPDGRSLLVARVDETAVPAWHIADPAAPWNPPRPHRYPVAGAANADVRLAVLGVDDGRRVDVDWDREAFPYVARVAWAGENPEHCTLLVQARDQRTAQILTVEPTTGATTLVRTLTDPAWVELIGGSPAWAGPRLVTVEDHHDHGEGGSRALVVDGEVVTPPGRQVRRVVAAEPDGVTYTASDTDPTDVTVWRWSPEPGLGGPRGESPGSQRRSPETPGVHGAVVRGEVEVITATDLEAVRPRVEVRWDATGSDPGTVRSELEVRTEAPSVAPAPRWLELGPRGLRAALLLPTGTAPDGPGMVGPDGPEGEKLPVLLDPYGGPHVQRVLRARGALVTSQWWADQGFAVLVVDGRGSPGRGPVFERAVAGDLATPVLDDQVDALYAAAELEPRLDLDRVAIRGWSFGGYLSALAVLRRPDVFRAAVAGAPVTDWALYDTHYTERYLGQPGIIRPGPTQAGNIRPGPTQAGNVRPGPTQAGTDAQAYAVSSVVDASGALPGAAPWTARGPQLLLIHGLADDNVVAAHSLRLSAALLADGRAHRFLPLSGVTHMTPQEQIAERLLTTQVAFLHEALAARGRPPPTTSSSSDLDAGAGSA